MAAINLFHILIVVPIFASICAYSYNGIVIPTAFNICLFILTILILIGHSIKLVTTPF